MHLQEVVRFVGDALLDLQLYMGLLAPDEMKFSASHVGTLRKPDLSALERAPDVEGLLMAIQGRFESLTASFSRSKLVALHSAELRELSLSWGSGDTPFIISWYVEGIAKALGPTLQSSAVLNGFSLEFTFQSLASSCSKLRWFDVAPQHP